MTDPHEDEQIILLAPSVDQDDIEQEFAILTWLGKEPSRRILYRRAQRYESLLFDFTADLPGATELSWSDLPVADLDTYQQLTTWALAQSEVTQQLVLNFLSDPKEEELPDLLNKLGLSEEGPKQKENTLTSLIKDYCREPRTLSELYDLARGFLCSARPEAAVRQALRRLVKSGQLTKGNDDVYRLS